MGKVVRFMMAIKEINERKLRKLQSTDTSDSESGSNGTYVSPNATEFNTSNLDPEGAEVGNATAADGKVPAGKPVSTTQTLSNNKKNPVQILKFHSFKVSGQSIKFGSHFYFINKLIPYAIFLRLRVTYPSSSLRNLQSEMADSLRTECKINDDDTSLAGNTATGNNINYGCEATASQNAENANITLNTDYDLVFVDKNGDIYENVGFGEISLNGNASEEAANLQDNTDEVSKVGTLKNSNAGGDTSTLTINGTINPTDTLDGVSKIQMDLLDKNDAKKQYTCEVSTESSLKVLKCDASSQQISTYAKNLHLSTGYSKEQGGVLLTVEMLNSDDTTEEINVGSNGHYYSKSSSSGLSGGAISGIVIACVAVLLAATIAAIMLKKPTPPVDNTTVAELRTDNI